MRVKHLGLAILTFALSCGGVLLALRADEPVKNPPEPAARVSFNPRYTPVVDLVKRVKGSVVNIHSERSVRPKPAEEFFSLTPSQNRVNGMGTGVIVDPRGYIVTNNHVVEDVNSIRVRLADGSTTPARVVARDNVEDLAVIKIDVNRPLPTIPLGTSEDLMVGETVVAIGNAFGYDHTVSVGIISALHRDVTLNKEISYKDLIQTDTPINPGNSGGPLLNIRGELIGINVAIRAGAQGIGFAIPVDAVVRVSADLIGAAKRGGPSLGIVTRDHVTPHETRAPDRELIVEAVDGYGAAAQAGLKAGDVIIRADGNDVFCRLDLERHLNEKNAGDKAVLEVRRGGQSHKLQVAFESSARQNPAAVEVAWRKLGLRPGRPENDSVSKANKQLNGGLLIDEIRTDSPASRAGIQRGDILVGLHQWEMLNLDNIIFVLNHPDLDSFLPLKFYIIRGGQVHRGWLQTTD